MVWCNDHETECLDVSKEHECHAQVSEENGVDKLFHFCTIEGCGAVHEWDEKNQKWIERENEYA